MQDETPKNPIKGGKNLVLLGILAVAFALITTGISLMIYHNSGDIYLDRSRPGFLPDEEEVEQKKEDSKNEIYDFSKEDGLTAETIERYLSNLDEEVKTLNAFEKPFDAYILSDDHFGIPSE